MLTLRVLSCKGEKLPAPYEAEFDEAGGSIGRTPDNRLALPHDASVSTIHATVRFLDGRYFLTAQSRNPNRVNGRELKNGVEQALADGDELDLGASRLVVSVRFPESDVRALSFRMLEDIARDLSGESICFPTFLDITLKVRNALKNPKLSIEELGTLVSAEPLLSAKVIRLANSVAMNRSGRPILAVNGAIAKVGMEAVRGLSFAVAIEQLLSSKKMVAFEALSLRLWEHSIHVAALCRVLARRLTGINPDEAMFAGLIHDIGVFYLLSRAASFPQVSDDRAELHQLLVDWHGNIGHALLAAMGLPEEVATVIQGHDLDRVVATVKTLADVLFVANRLASLEHGWRDPTLSDAAPANSLSDLFDAEALGALLADSAEEVSSLKSVLGA
ncbi:MAG TPA: HDOD domain-containing protein [Accumulibacter sp.]|uniref:HDOD domain-containing protein n=1 Tax=Accumulibacter sp. TaxID=2053492 RepID=UPI002C445875|nr:HDOD domain-containing protein [Accumulibacter sp.]HRF71412.1 HDOD domain-containing protein [Accumulibacter sp.]